MRSRIFSSWLQRISKLNSSVFFYLVPDSGALFTIRTFVLTNNDLTSDIIVSRMFSIYPSFFPPLSVLLNWLTNFFITRFFLKEYRSSGTDLPSLTTDFTREKQWQSKKRDTGVSYSINGTSPAPTRYCYWCGMVIVCRFGVSPRIFWLENYDLDYIIEVPSWSWHTTRDIQRTLQWIPRLQRTLTIWLCHISAKDGI